ncbi:MAG: hypothetical protein K2W96_15945 [Gemmataceae bacterium]|nr:hypothetical protein [Gemmataceae bacterium]
MKRIGLAVLAAVLAIMAAGEAEGARKRGKGAPTTRNKKEEETGGLIDPFGEGSKLPGSTGPINGGTGGGGTGGGGGKLLDPFAPGGKGGSGSGTGSGGGKLLDPFAPSGGGGKKK